MGSSFQEHVTLGHAWRTLQIESFSFLVSRCLQLTFRVSCLGFFITEFESPDPCSATNELSLLIEAAVTPDTGAGHIYARLAMVIWKLL